MMRFKRLIILTSLILISSVVSMWGIIFLLPTPPLLTDISYSRAIYDEHQKLLRLTLSDDTKYRLFTPLSAFSPLFIQATLLQEDQYYYWHMGINPAAMLRASWQMAFGGSRRLGASTITMQVARLRFGIHSKTWLGKVIQMIYALRLEAHYSKKQILEAYLNLAPYGNNIEGAGSASLIYFGKSAHDLSLPEALTLAVMPQNPNQRLPNRKLLKETRAKLYARWLVSHPADRNKQALITLPLQMRGIHHLPFLAPHFVNNVLAKYPSRAGIPLEITTTLDLKLQKTIECVTRNYIARKSSLGVNNAAVLLVDTRNMGIKAMLGSVNFFSPPDGQINGTDTQRSPGSTLKPFIYALALDQGLIHPATVLKDVPRSFGSYNPENFDNDFVGPIKAKEALVLSRNIPAIYLADQLTHPSLYDFLRQAGIKNLKAESYYGLALVLGGAELSMQELVSLYAMLNNNGLYQPLRFSKNDKPSLPERLLSPEASFLIREMLKETPSDTHYAGALPQQPFAWKTGTSSGYRDAWTVGLLGPYALAVWIGNFNNQGNPIFIGKSIAAPLFFEIAEAIHGQMGTFPTFLKTSQDLNLTKVDVCKASGLLPTRNCPETEKVWFIPGKSPIKTDNIYREIAIDNKTGLRACHIDQNVHFAVYEFWSSDLLQIFKRAGIQRRSPPPFAPGCIEGIKPMEGLIPQIVSPQIQVNYVRRLASSQATLIPFSAVVDADVKYVYWFLNETFLGKTTRDKPFLWRAKPGNYVVRAVDDFGRADAREVKVQLEQ